MLRELTIAGLGISQLALEYFQDDIDAGLMRVVESTPAPPRMVYSGVWRADRFSPALELIAERSAQVCDFRWPSARRSSFPGVGGA